MNVTGPGKRDELPIKKLVSDKERAWSLRVLTSKKKITGKIRDRDLVRPGLALTGFTEEFTWERIQIIGEAEWLYINSLNKATRAKKLVKFFSYPMPCILFTKSQRPPKDFLDTASSKSIPVLSTPLGTVEVMRELKNYLDDFFAFTTTVHASLVDVYGVGMLYTGKAGIGKSECCLDLVERGHRLVADDIVHILRKGEILIGSGNEIIGHHMEIRGVGIIDVQSLFGIRAILKAKKIEVEVELVDWTSDIDYERLGIEENTVDLLGVPIQKVRVPVSPGKNITVISEVIAMNVLLKTNGINPAKDFNQRLIQSLQERKRKKAKL